MAIFNMGPKRIILNDIDISKWVRRVEIDVEAGQYPMVELHILTRGVTMDEEGNITISTFHATPPTHS